MGHGIVLLKLAYGPVKPVAPVMVEPESVWVGDDGIGHEHFVHDVGLVLIEVDEVDPEEGLGPRGVGLSGGHAVCVRFEEGLVGRDALVALAEEHCSEQNLAGCCVLDEAPEEARGGVVGHEWVFVDVAYDQPILFASNILGGVHHAVGNGCPLGCRVVDFWPRFEGVEEAIVYVAAVFVIAVGGDVCDSGAAAHIGDPVAEMVVRHAELVAWPEAEHDACINNNVCCCFWGYFRYMFYCSFDSCSS